MIIGTIPRFITRKNWIFGLIHCILQSNYDFHMLNITISHNKDEGIGKLFNNAMGLQRAAMMGERQSRHILLKNLFCVFLNCFEYKGD